MQSQITATSNNFFTMKTYIWTLPTRFFHWLLAISFTITYIIGSQEMYPGLHAALGSMIGGLVLFRILQGFTGPKYVRFSDFPVSPASIMSFLTSMKQNKANHPGHNPLASVIMLCILATALISAISGMLIFASAETGFLGLRNIAGVDKEIFENFHEVIVNVFLVLVGIHLAGILADTLFHPGNGTIFSIFTGYKNIEAAPAGLSPSQRIFSLFWFLIPACIFLYVLFLQPLPAGTTDKTEQVTKSDNDED
jgi:cytochrome b